MKKILGLSALAVMAILGAADAANVTLYYSPTCPHCHHAREFMANRLVYEYPTVSVTAVNVMDAENLPEFRKTLEKCNYSSGGVPVIVIGDKCFQGYANFMQKDLRDAVAVDLTDAQRKTAAENQAALDQDADAFRAKNAARVIVERTNAESEKKNNDGNVIYFYGLLAALVVAMGVVVLGRRKK